MNGNCSSGRWYYKVRSAELRAQIDAADAEIEAGLGVTFADARALTDEILRRGKERLTNSN
jgi:hypothetical protein